MARKFAKIDEWEVWVPPIGDERKLFEVEPEEAVTMELRFLSKEQRDAYGRKAERYKRLGHVTSADEKAARELIDENVRNIKNYGYEDEPVTTGGELFDFPGDNKMVVAVTEALFDRSKLDEGLAKKLHSRFDTCTSHRRKSNRGDAQGAIQASDQTTKEATSQPLI